MRSLYLSALSPFSIQVQLYSKTGTLGGFRDMVAAGGADSDRAVEALNHLVADALSLAPQCLRYLSGLTHPDVFRFCAIPQVRS
jgi:hypothetical protein